MLIYVGSYNLANQPSIHGIKLCQINEQWQLQPQTTIESIASASYLHFDKPNQQLFAVSEIDTAADQASGWIAQFDLSQPLQPKLIAQQLSQGSHPCHLALHELGLVCSNYSGGNLAYFNILGQTPLDKAAQLFQHHGSSIISERQSQAHIHSASVSPNGAWIVVADLGCDTLTTYGFDQNQGLQKVASFNMPAGSGPRHCAFHPSGACLYVANELNNSISQLSISEAGELALIETLAATDTDTLNYPAEIALDSAGKFLYVSNRGDDSISCFSVEPTLLQLKYMASCPSGGKFPRHFAISPDQCSLVVANQQSNSINLLLRDPDTGHLTLTDTAYEVNAPSCICFID